MLLCLYLSSQAEGAVLSAIAEAESQQVVDALLAKTTDTAAAGTHLTYLA